MVDSRFKSINSTSNTDFKIELTDNLQIPPYTGCVITDVVIPRTFYNVNKTNNKLYFRIKLPNSNYNDYIITLTPQNYNLFGLSTELMNKMNNAIGFNYLQAQANTSLGKILITIVDVINVASFSIFTNSDLLTKCNGTWRGPFYNINNLTSLNSNLNNDDRLPSQEYTQYYSGVVDLLGTHTIYIKSSTLCNYSNIGPGAEQNIVKKIMNNVEFGNVIIYENYLIEDYVDVSDRYLKVIDFQITDAFGNVLDLLGSHISFSILFIDTKRYQNFK